MSQSSLAPLQSTYQIGSLTLRNRIVMASMTRGRARNEALAPTDLHVQYYRQRATAGLILTEGIWISPSAVGAVNVPGIYTQEQVQGWRAVADAVHGEGGLVFAQLGHAGAVSHPDFHDGRAPLAPSAVNPHLQAFTSQGFKETSVPREMTIDQIQETVSDYAAAARHALDAGFDGVELHAGLTYLVAEFLNSRMNVRNDIYGGNSQNRARFALEIIDALIKIWGAGRVGIKLAPTARMGGFAPNMETIGTFDYLIDRLNTVPLAYVQMVRASYDLRGSEIEALEDTISYYRQRYNGTLIANGGYDNESANAVIRAGDADIVSFATPFIANPDFVRRLKYGLPMATSARDSYYQGDSLGYIDFPFIGA